MKGPEIRKIFAPGLQPFCRFFLFVSNACYLTGISTDRNVLPIPMQIEAFKVKFRLIIKFYFGSFFVIIITKFIDEPNGRGDVFQLL